MSRPVLTFPHRLKNGYFTLLQILLITILYDHNMEIWGECRILFTKQTKSFQIQLNAYCVTDDRIDAETAEVTLRTKVSWDT